MWKLAAAMRRYLVPVSKFNLQMPFPVPISSEAASQKKLFKGLTFLLGNWNFFFKLRCKE